MQVVKRQRNGVTLYEFTSDSNPGYTYYVTVKGGVIDLDLHKDCRGFVEHGHCKHIDHITLTDASLLKRPINHASQAITLEEKPLQYKPFSILR